MSREEEKLKRLIESIVEKELSEGPITDPFTDIFKTASYGFKKLGATLGMNFLKLFRQSLTTLIPYITHGEITRISHETAAKKKSIISNLDSQYQDVLNRNMNAFNNADIAAATLLLNPKLYLGAKSGLFASSAALGVLDMITSPFPNLNISVSNLKQRVDKLNQTSTGWQGQGSGGSGFGAGGMGDGGYGDFGDGDGGMYQESAGAPNTQQQLSALLTNPNLIKAVKASDLVKSLDRVSLNIIKSSVDELDRVTTFDGLKKLMPQKEFDQLKDKSIELMKSNIKTKKHIHELEAEIVLEMKAIYKKVYRDLVQKKINDPMFSVPEEARQLLQKLN